MMMFKNKCTYNEPLSIPPHWIVKWVDHSKQTCMAYELSCGAVGVYFTDEESVWYLTLTNA